MTPSPTPPSELAALEAFDPEAIRRPAGMDDDAPVLIYSHEHGAYWRPDASGYTTRFNQAGVYTASDAERRISHCWREKRLQIEPLPALRPSTPVAGEGLDEVIDAAWIELCERDDRTSPEEFPEMCLIEQSELAEFMWRAALSNPQPTASAGLVAGYHVANLVDNLRETAIGCDHCNEASLAEMCTAAADVIAALSAHQGAREPIDTEMLGEALFNLSDKLRQSGFCEKSENHAAYERVVAAFTALTDQRQEARETAEALAVSHAQGFAAGMKEAARFVEQWNGKTADGNTFLIASELRTLAQQPAPTTVERDGGAK